jgi:hypothetical protein
MFMVYFIECDTGTAKYIKIGSSENPERRLEELQASNPLPLRLLGTRDGGRKEEMVYHSLFWHLHVRGEWFRPNEVLLRHARSI